VDIVPFWYEERTPIAITATRWHTCVRTDSDFVHCWGYNGDGGLGLGHQDVNPQATPRDWGLLTWDSPARELAGGQGHTCVRLANTELRCWGTNDKAQLGRADLETLGDDETVTLVNRVAPIDLGQNAQGRPLEPSTVAAGYEHTCVLLTTGEVICWGYNAEGQLGLGYVSEAPDDFVGGNDEQIPSLLPRVAVLSAGG
jgi:alpha-tubulin suppressor-like RCC1 family protein